MLNMVVGYAFNKEKTHVVLIRKTKPSWQAGKLNGVGGKLEPHESMLQAMSREFLEETGVKTEWHEWQHFAEMSGADWRVQYYRTFSNAILEQAHTTTDEAIEILPVDLNMLRKEGVTNCYWLIGLALDPDQPRIFTHVSYDGYDHSVTPPQTLTPHPEVPQP